VSRAFIVGAGAVTWGGLGLEPIAAAIAGDGKAFATEEPVPGAPVTVGRVGSIKDPASQATYRRWGQVDTYSRYGYVAARLALEQAGLAGDVERAGYGVFLGTAYGCMEENQRFDKYRVEDGVLRGASPLVFKGTVDNAPAGWIAVAWGLKGPNATFVSGDGAGAESLWAGLRQIAAGRAPGLLCGGVERFVDLHLVLREREPRWQGAVLSEGAGVVLVEDEESMTARGATPLAEVLGVVRHRGSLVEGLRAVAGRLRIDLADVGLISLAVPDQARLDEEREAFGATARGGSDGSALSGVAIVADKTALGESHGAWGGLALCAALVRLEDGRWGGRPVAVVQVKGEGNENFYVALRGPGNAE